jgi:hypothetical protein
MCLYYQSQWLIERERKRERNRSFFSKTIMKHRVSEAGQSSGSRRQSSLQSTDYKCYN